MGKQLKGYKKLELEGLQDLRNSANLLGFSAQVDSTGLFFLLLANGIDFDIAIINYKTRKQSFAEVKRAKKLAKKYNKKIFIKDAKEIQSNFESEARKIRFNFFEEIIKKYKYENLILANQLNDKVEWILMQFSKGCGLGSLLGFESKSSRENYKIIRPLINIRKEEILKFLKKNKIKFFIDESNKSQKIKRNFFRKNYANSLVSKFHLGILKSIAYLQNDFNSLYLENKHIKISNIYIFRFKLEFLNLHKIDKLCKILGYVISRKQREEIVKSKYSCTLANRIILDSNEEYIFLTTNENPLKHNKKFRNTLRINKIPPKIRPFVDSKILEEIKIKLKDY